jgi:hypothetical protein
LVFDFRLGEGCTHITGLLFALENITETQEKKMRSTQQLVHQSLASGTNRLKEVKPAKLSTK